VLRAEIVQFCRSNAAQPSPVEKGDANEKNEKNENNENNENNEKKQEARRSKKKQEEARSEKQKFMSRADYVPRTMGPNCSAPCAANGKLLLIV